MYSIYVFSGSSSISLVKGGRADLSRRAQLKPMYGFSFREFLEIKENSSYPILPFGELIENQHKFAAKLMLTPKLLGYFKIYLKEGYYPTFIDLKTLPAFK